LIPCSLVVYSAMALHAALGPAPPGKVICLGNGHYGKLELSAEKRAPGVTIRAAHPGRATIDGAELSGSNLALAHFKVSDEIVIEPGSRKVSVLNNRISGGYFGVEAGPTTTTSISDTTIRGNLFAGPFGEDAIRLNRYHDSGDRDPYGVLIEGNEIRGVRENGNHSDCLQSVWGGDGLYFRRNYLHDNRCQGFFVKDQPAPVAHVVLENSAFALRAGPFGKVTVTDNVLFKAWSDWSGPFQPFVQGGNLACEWEGTLPPLQRSSERECEPAFRAPAKDDYRLPGGPGVDWAPRQQHYGP
jgi:hypothetical protein